MNKSTGNWMPVLWHMKKKNRCMKRWKCVKRQCGFRFAWVWFFPSFISFYHNTKYTAYLVSSLWIHHTMKGKKEQCKKMKLMIKRKERTNDQERFLQLKRTAKKKYDEEVQRKKKNWTFVSALAIFFRLFAGFGKFSTVHRVIYGPISNWLILHVVPFIAERETTDRTNSLTKSRRHNEHGEIENLSIRSFVYSFLTVVRLMRAQTIWFLNICLISHIFQDPSLFRVFGWQLRCADTTSVKIGFQCCTEIAYIFRWANRMH